MFIWTTFELDWFNEKSGAILQIWPLQDVYINICLFLRFFGLDIHVIPHWFWWDLQIAQNYPQLSNWILFIISCKFLLLVKLFQILCFQRVRLRLSSTRQTNCDCLPEFCKIGYILFQVCFLSALRLQLAVSTSLANKKFYRRLSAR